MAYDQISVGRLYYSTSPISPVQAPSYYIFFITGNPGLIQYYQPFLSCLASLLDFSTPQFFILGTSLAGFEDETLASSDPQERPPFGLQKQIQLAEERLHGFIRLRHRQSAGPTRVILIGHSVGAYIALEIIRRNRVLQREPSLMNIVGGILLFPTVTHIAKSPSGIKLSVYA